LVHEVSLAEELVERRRTYNNDHTGLEVEEYRAGLLLAARGPVVKHADAAKLRVVGSRFARDDKEPGPRWGKQLPRERPRETAET
jgi:hypothetical protein